MRRWKLPALLALALLVGAGLRFANVQDMEYKEDEEINFTQSQAIVASFPRLPATGMPSGVYIPNPGLSVWMFGAAAAASGAKTPTELERAVQVVSLLGICLILPFAFFFARPGRERELWLWAYALALVNPFLVLYHRKLWPQPFLPIFAIPMYMGFYRRDRRFGAAAWGLFSALLGQVHMAGFFVAAGLALWTLIRDRRGVRWSAWFGGSALGALPLLPWLKLALAAKRGGSITALSEPLQFKYWAFWITDTLGLHLGNPLGLSRGGALAQISDFNRYPLIGGEPTYLVALAHGAIVVLALALVLGAIVALYRRRPQGLLWELFKQYPRQLWGVLRHLPSRSSVISSTQLAGQGIFLVAGILLTVTCINIRRYYLCATFPFEAILLAAFALFAFGERRGRSWLAALWIAQAIVSACFVNYVHVNQGAPAGDYGDAYHVVMEKRRQHESRP